MKTHYIQKNIFINLTLVLFSTIIVLAILEISIRVFMPLYNPNGDIYFVSLEDGTQIAPKNFSGRQWHSHGDYNVPININQYGFRDKKDLRDSNNKDIFAAGDSFSFGWGVEEQKRYSNILENLIKIPVYNISTSGDFDSYDKLINYAKMNGARIHNLIIGVCMENDLLFYEDRENKNNEVLYTKRIPTWFRYLKNILVKKSATYKLLTSAVNQNETLTKIAVRLKLAESSYVAIEKHHFDQNLITQSADRLTAIAKKYNSIVLIIPSRMLYYGGNREELMIHNAFVSLLKERGLMVIDMYGHFKASNPLSFHFSYDGHWNNTGHELAGEVLYEYVEKANIFGTKK